MANTKLKLYTPWKPFVTPLNANHVEAVTVIVQKQEKTNDKTVQKNLALFCSLVKCLPQFCQSGKIHC